MRVMEDKIAAVDEPSSERMQFRTKPHIKRAIQKAAALSGMDDTTFAMNAAYQQALDTIERHERIMLKPEDYEAFFNALDNPPGPTEALRAAFRDYKATVTSR